MRMLEAFKRLLDGEKITRPDWGGAYIVYDDDVYHNRFIGVLNGKAIGATKQPQFTESISHYKMIAFDFRGEEESMIISLMDDDRNEIYVSEEEKMELDAMRWRLKAMCSKNYGCSDCQLKEIKYNKYEGNCPLAFCSLTEGLSDEEIKKLYKIIEESDNEK